MDKANILISGPTIARDEFLLKELRNIATVTRNADNSCVPSVLEQKPFDLLLLEVPVRNRDEIEMIREIKHGNPRLEIILIDGSGDSERVAQAFAYGIRDAFRAPYKWELIVERVEALLRRHGEIETAEKKQK